MNGDDSVLERLDRLHSVNVSDLITFLLILIVFRPNIFETLVPLLILSIVIVINTIIVRVLGDFISVGIVVCICSRG
jgi:hypothetical protein